VLEYKPSNTRTIPLSQHNPNVIIIPPLPSEILPEPTGISPWPKLTTSATTRSTKQQNARREATLAETMNQVKSLIGEFPSLPSFSLSRKPEREQANAQLPTEQVDGPKRAPKSRRRANRTSRKATPANRTAPDWPNNLIAKVKEVLEVPCPTRTAPEFIFELSDRAAEHNIKILEKYEFDLGKALEANKNSPLSYGSEFRDQNELRKIFSLHPLWPRWEAILSRGSKWPLEELREVDRKKDLIDALTFGNHKGATAKPELL
jgi:hypothetical protein